MDLFFCHPNSYYANDNSCTAFANEEPSQMDPFPDLLQVDKYVMVVKLDTACISLYSKILPLLVQSSILQTKTI